jgi:hypothetical protein
MGPDIEPEPPINEENEVEESPNHLTKGEDSELAPNEVRKQRLSITQRARTVAQRKLQSAAQSREANMAVILVSSVIMFIICHLPRMFVTR